MNTSPINYWRNNKSWPDWLGKVGRVVVATTVLNGPPTTEKYTPYPYAIIAIGDQQIEVMGLSGEQLLPGDRVQLVLRKIQDTGERGVVFYGLKVQKCL